MTRAHAIRVTYIGPSNSRGARVQLASLYFKGDHTSLPYDHKFTAMVDQAVDYLTALGFSVIAYADGPRNTDLIMVKEFNSMQSKKVDYHV